MATLLTKKYKLLSSVTSSTNSVLRLYGKYNSQDVQKNESSITLELRLYGNGGSGSFASGTAKINDSTTTLGNTAYTKGKETILKTLTYTAKHDSNGEYKDKTIKASLTSSATPKGNISTQISLPSIPRTSTLLATDGYIGSSIVLTIDRKLSTYTDSISWECGSLNGVIATKSTDKTFGFTIPVEIYGLIPNARQTTIKYTITTYSGDTEIGTNIVNAKAIVDEIENAPNMAYNMMETNQALIDLQGSNIFDYVIYNASKPKFQLSATAKNGATIKSYSISCNDGQTILSNEYTFGNVLGNKFTLVATDSRGITNTIIIDKTNKTIDYNKPSIRTFSAERESPISGEIIIDAEGSYYKGNLFSIQNNIEIYYRYKNSQEDDYGNWTKINNSDIILSEIDNTYKISNLNLGDITLYNQVYNFQLGIKDILTTEYTTLTDDVYKGIPTMDMGEHDLNVNGDITISDIDGENPINIMDMFFFKNGDSFEINQLWLAGTFTNGNKQIIFTIPLPKSMKNVNASVINAKMTARCDNAYVLGSGSSQESVFVTTTKSDEYYLKITYDSSVALGGTNNSAVAIFFTGTINFS